MVFNEIKRGAGFEPAQNRCLPKQAAGGPINRFGTHAYYRRQIRYF